jgi:hypothetical protein
VSTDEKVEHSLDLRGSPMNFAIVLRYQDGVELHVPVEADAIRPDKTELPKGYSLRVRVARPKHRMKTGVKPIFMRRG